MNCKRIQRHWPAWAAGDLTPKQGKAFSAHLAACPECAQKARELSGAAALAARTLPEPEALPDPAFLAMLAAAARVPAPPRRRRLAAYSVALAAAAFLAIMLWLPSARLPTEGPADGGAADGGGRQRDLALVDAARAAQRYEMRLATNDPKIKIVWVFDSDLNI